MFEHQTANSIGKDIYNGFYYRGVSWQNHLHKCPEITICLEGEITLTLSEGSHTLRAGEIAFVSPYRLHAYSSEPSSLCFIAVFSDEYVSHFRELMRGKEFDLGIIKPKKTTFDYVCSGLLTIPPNEKKTLGVPKPAILTLKACLYAALSELYENRALVKAKRDEGLIYKMINYVEESFTQDISLEGMARHLGYDHRYVSRVFNEAMGIGFKAFVNQYRCDMVKSLIREGNKSLTEIALASGFQSVRTFNRVYKQTFGSAPRSRS